MAVAYDGCSLWLSVISGYCLDTVTWSGPLDMCAELDHVMTLNWTQLYCGIELHGTSGSVEFQVIQLFFKKVVSWVSYLYILRRRFCVSFLLLCFLVMCLLANSPHDLLYSTGVRSTNNVLGFSVMKINHKLDHLKKKSLVNKKTGKVQKVRGSMDFFNQKIKLNKNRPGIMSCIPWENCFSWVLRNTCQRMTFLKVIFLYHYIHCSDWMCFLWRINALSWNASTEVIVHVIYFIKFGSRW